VIGPKPRLRRSGILALASGAAFAAITVLYRAGATRDLDHELHLWILDFRAPWLDALATTDDVLFRSTATFAAAAVLAAILWRFGPRWSWCAPLAIVVAVFAEAIVKNGFGQILHLRTLIEGLQVIFGGHFHSPASFPSGHVTRAMFLAVVGLAFLPRIVSVPLALFALTTLLARLYTEQHRLSDVLGGASLGICIGCAAVWAVPILASMEGELRKRWRPASSRLIRRAGAYRN
jgi:membrane-associated phospholipid phosphatase